jgi:hypothetical protein
MEKPDYNHIWEEKISVTLPDYVIIPDDHKFRIRDVRINLSEVLAYKEEREERLKVEGYLGEFFALVTSVHISGSIPYYFKLELEKKINGQLTNEIFFISDSIPIKHTLGKAASSSGVVKEMMKSPHEVWAEIDTKANSVLKVNDSYIISFRLRLTF